MRKRNAVLLGEWIQAGNGVSYRDRSGSTMKRITRMLCFERASWQGLRRLSVICGTDIEKCGFAMLCRQDVESTDFVAQRGFGLV